MNYKLKKTKSNLGDWSHTIYLYNSTGKKTFGDLLGQHIVFNSDSYVWNNNNYLKLDKIDFEFGELVNFERYDINGFNKDTDLLVMVI